MLTATKSDILNLVLNYRKRYGENKMGKIYIRTYAYNAEKTLRRAVESVLNQTYSDFIYYLCDNGSTDRTKEIVQEYAAKDKRIKAFYNKYNYVSDENDECLYLPCNIKEDDYFCTLDADDEYKPEFLEYAMSFLEINHLDIVVCGSEFLDVAKNNQLLGYRMLKQNLILINQDFATFFPTYHVFLRTFWGKLYKGKTVVHTIQDSNTPGYPKSYGGDTYNALIAFRNAEHVGILAKPLHKYYVSNNSVSYQYNSDRIDTDVILHEATMEYLNSYGPVSLKNREFMLAVYMNAIRDTFNVIIKSSVELIDKLDSVFRIYNSPYIKQLAAAEAFGRHFNQEKEWELSRAELFSGITNWLVSQLEIPDKIILDYCEMGEFYSAAGSLENEWLFFKKLRVHFLLDNKEYSETVRWVSELEELVPDDSQVLVFRKIIEGNGYGKNNN